MRILQEGGSSAGIKELRQRTTETGRQRQAVRDRQDEYRQTDRNRQQLQHNSLVEKLSRILKPGEVKYVNRWKNGFIGLQKVLLRSHSSDKVTVRSLMQCVLAPVQPHKENLADSDLLIPKRSQRRYRSATPTGDATMKGAGRPSVCAIETAATVEFFFWSYICAVGSEK